MELDIEQIVREYLDKTIHMSMATVSDDKPWVCEVHFTYDENLNLYFHSKPDTRHCQEIAKNPNVAGNIVAQHGPEDSPHGIYFEGTAEADLTEDREDSKEKYKIKVENWYAFGKFGGDTNQKYKLPWSGGVK